MVIENLKRIKFSLKDNEDTGTFGASVMVLVMSLTVWPLFGYIYLKIFPAAHDSIFDRFIGVSPAILFLLILWRIPQSRKYSQMFVVFMALTIYFHLLILLYANQLDISYVAGFFVTVSTFIALIVQPTGIIIYVSCVVVGTFVLAVIIPEAKMNVWLFLSLTYVESILATFVNMQKITSFLKLEKQKARLIESEKLASIGILSAGVAHEINNPLAIITGQCDILLNKINNNKLENTDLIQKIDKISSTAHRISNITKTLLIFSGQVKDKDNQNISDVITAIENAKKFNEQKVFDKNIKIITECEDSIKVKGGLAIVTQVFVTLLANSVDALENAIQPEINIKAFRSGNDIVTVIYSDNGHGIDESIKDKIFLPFFTTKEPGKGTGMGLSLAKLAVERLGGDLSLTKLHGPTVFTIHLPSAE